MEEKTQWYKTDEGKKRLQQEIDKLNKSKAKLVDNFRQRELHDGTMAFVIKLIPESTREVKIIFKTHKRHPLFAPELEIEVNGEKIKLYLISILQWRKNYFLADIVEEIWKNLPPVKPTLLDKFRNFIYKKKNPDN